MQQSYKSRIKVDISGIEELGKKVKKLKGDLFAILPEAVLAGADIVRDAAKDKARRKSGELADGIVSTITWDKKAPVAFAGAGVDKSKNAIFVKYDASGKRYYYPASIEYGHPKAPAYPFLRPAHEENRTKARKEVRDRVKKLIEGVR